MDIENADFIIKYENIQEDFSRVLNILNIKQMRALPWDVKTTEKDRNFLKYYTPKIQQKVKFIFGDAMKCLGYEFPFSWKMRNLLREFGLTYE